MKRLLPVWIFWLLAPGAWAWNDTGHKTVALIAWDDLKPTVRTNVTTLLRAHPQYATLIQTPGSDEEESRIQEFMTAATWSDLIRADRPENRPYNRPSWHLTVFPFITVDLPEAKRPAPFRLDWKPGEEPDNIVQALLKCTADLRDSKLDEKQRAVSLTWILHLMGDIHQPMHTTSWYNEEHPDGVGDRRGNLTFVNRGNAKVTLHAYWDDVLGRFVSFASTRTTVNQLKQEHPRSEFAGALKDPSFENWARQGHELCRTIVYMDGALPHGRSARDNIPVLPQTYQDQANALGRKWIVLAGYRLADELNRLFEPDLPTAGD